jgi:CheY-like chemotaxis protein
MKCLLIDDDLDDQEIFELTLKKINRDAIFSAASDAPEAINMLSNGEIRPDYIFLDMNMPKMDGIECLAEIRKLPSIDQCKIYMYSTTSDEALVRRVKSMGAVDFIVKPATTAALQQALADIFSV